jgi:hypothetical protein
MAKNKRYVAARMFIFVYLLGREVRISGSRSLAKSPQHHFSATNGLALRIALAASATALFHPFRVVSGRDSCKPNRCIDTRVNLILQCVGYYRRLASRLMLGIDRAA